MPHGSGRSRRLDKFGAQYLLHDLGHDAREAAHYKAVFDKDLAYALEQGRLHGIRMPVAELSMRLREVLPSGDDIEELLRAWHRIVDAAA